MVQSNLVTAPANVFDLNPANNSSTAITQSRYRVILRDHEHLPIGRPFPSIATSVGAPGGRPLAAQSNSRTTSGRTAQ